MSLFPTRKPRGFRYRPRYSRQRVMDFHRSLRRRPRPDMLKWLVLLVLLLLLWGAM